jgi:MFS family permease
MLATLRQRNFSLLWLSSLISFIGDWVLIIGLPVYVYDMTSSTLATGGMFIAMTLPRLLFESLAGVFIDRWDRRRTLIVVNVGQALLLPLLLLVRSPDQLWLLYIVAFAQATLATFLQPAERALVPTLIKSDQLLTANGLLAMNWELTRLFAPPLGGLMMGVLGIGSTVLLDSVSFLLAGSLIAAIAAQPGAAEARPVAGEQAASLATIWRDLVNGLRLAWNDRLIRALMIIGSVAMVSEGIGNVLGFPWLKEALGGGAVERGWLTSAQAVGGLAGGLVIGRLSRRVSPTTLIAASGLLLGTTTLALINITAFPIAPSLYMPLALVLKTMQGIPIIGFFVSLDTLLQQASPDRYRGRIFGAYGMLCALAMLIGQLAASLLSTHFGIVPIYSGVGYMFAAAGLLALVLLHGVAITSSDLALARSDTAADLA